MEIPMLVIGAAVLGAVTGWVAWRAWSSRALQPPKYGWFALLIVLAVGASFAMAPMGTAAEMPGAVFVSVGYIVGFVAWFAASRNRSASPPS